MNKKDMLRALNDLEDLTGECANGRELSANEISIIRQIGATVNNLKKVASIEDLPKNLQKHPDVLE